MSETLNKSPFSLVGSEALVTGSTHGIGQAVALAMEQAGAKVIRHGLNPGSPTIFDHDLLQDGAPVKLINDTFGIQPNTNILVCNAGGFFDDSFLNMDSDRFAKTMRLNVEQSYFLIQNFTKRLIKTGRSGSVILVGSTNGSFAEMDSTAYDASKGAIVMMVRSLALNLAKHGIRVNGIAPGLIRTPLTSRWMDSEIDRVKQIENRIPASRLGSPQDCAHACVFLCSEAANYIYGHMLVIDGGRTLGQTGYHNF